MDFNQLEFLDPEQNKCVQYGQRNKNGNQSYEEEKKKTIKNNRGSFKFHGNFEIKIQKYLKFKSKWLDQIED